eukprot:gene1013-4254_t
MSVIKNPKQVPIAVAGLTYPGEEERTEEEEEEEQVQVALQEEQCS